MGGGQKVPNASTGIGRANRDTAANEAVAHTRGVGKEGWAGQKDPKATLIQQELKIEARDVSCLKTA